MVMRVQGPEMSVIRSILLLGLTLFAIHSAIAQLSPGPLASEHSNLEGLSNCTQCHTLGSKVSNEKCLSCHSDLKKRIEEQSGYHASAAIKGRECISCHSDHHGSEFQMVRFEKGQFDHSLTGYKLQGAHAKAACNDCHKAGFITDPKIKTRKNTFLGLDTDCLNCHENYHQNTLSTICSGCHDLNTFKEAPFFDHAKAKFRLEGKHTTVSCINCHKKTEKNGKEFQMFTGIPYQQCINCHSDPHNNKFGRNCSECHSTVTFLTAGVKDNFDHSKTDYILENRHLTVKCSACHTSGYTQPLNFVQCTNCHADYHNGQFMTGNMITDCRECHDTKGFELFSFSVDRHQLTGFKLTGSHLAVSCIECHKKENCWQFSGLGTDCINCHVDIHENSIDIKYYPNHSCISCHNDENWNNISFDHSKTDFTLKGAHLSISCRSCHFIENTLAGSTQNFKGLATDCTNCHKDLHFSQFTINGITDCLRCHSDDNWLIPKFDHDRTAFRLEGKHSTVTCNQCHKPVEEGQNSYILYKIKDTRCESCHL